MVRDEEIQQMQDLAMDITILFGEKDVELHTAAAALALLLCNVGKEMGTPLDDLIEAFSNSAKLTYALPRETIQ